MEKIFALLLAGILCLTACAAGEADTLQEPEAGLIAPVVAVEPEPVVQPVPVELPEPEPVWTAAKGVTFSLLQDTYPVGTEELTLVIDNRTDLEIGWGTWESYEKYVDGQWEKLEYVEELCFADVLWVLQPDSVRTQTLCAMKFLPALDGGLYRVTGSEVFVGDEKAGPWQVSFRVAADAQPEPDYTLYLSSEPIPTVEGCAVMGRLPVYFINKTGDDYSVLRIPRLEKREESGTWTEVPFRDGIGFCGVSDPLPAGVTKGSEDTALLWGNLEDGRYRLSYALGPDAAMDPEAEQISGEFTLYTPENNAGLPLAPQD